MPKAKKRSLRSLRKWPKSTKEVVSEVYSAYNDDLCGGLRMKDGKHNRIVWVDGIARLHRNGELPAVITKKGAQIWYKHGSLHRNNDLPSIVLENGARQWFKDGVLHRDGNRPSVIYSDGDLEWWVDGERTGTSANPPEGAIFPGQFTKPARPQ